MNNLQNFLFIKYFMNIMQNITFLKIWNMTDSLLNKITVVYWNT